MLSKIIVYRLFNEYDYEIDLDNRRITFVHSQNGLGKSTVMKLVYNILEGNLEEVRTCPFERMDLMFDNGTNIIVENNNQELNILGQKAELEEEMSVEELRNTMKCIYVGPERMYTTDGKGHIVPSLMIYMTELSQKIGQAMKDSEPRKVEDDGRELSDADMDKLFRDLEAKIDFIKQAGFGPPYLPDTGSRQADTRSANTAKTTGPWHSPSRITWTDTTCSRRASSCSRT